MSKLALGAYHGEVCSGLEVLRSGAGFEKDPSAAGGDGKAARVRRCPEAFSRLGLGWKTTRGGTLLISHFTTFLVVVLNIPFQSSNHFFD